MCSGYVLSSCFDDDTQNVQLAFRRPVGAALTDLPEYDPQGRWPYEQLSNGSGAIGVLEFV